MKEIETIKSYDPSSNLTSITSTFDMHEILNKEGYVVAIIEKVASITARKISEEIYQEVLKRIDVQAIVNQSLPEVSKEIVKRMSAK